MPRATKGTSGQGISCQDMGMNVEGLAPAAENDMEADLSAEVVGVGRDQAQCLG